jgi:hypothetical protein
MSESNGLILQQFNINELAGATGLILGAVGGLLAVIWKSRCLCKCRVGCSDNCYIFDCQRMPPPDNTGDSSEEENNKDKPDKKDKKDKPDKPDKKLEKKTSKDLIYESEPEPESLLPSQNP